MVSVARYSYPPIVNKLMAKVESKILSKQLVESWHWH